MISPKPVTFMTKYMYHMYISGPKMSISQVSFLNSRSLHDMSICIYWTHSKFNPSPALLVFSLL